jgi:phosphomannomutase
VDEMARPIGEERTVVLAMDAYLRLFGKKGPLVVNLSTTSAVDHLARMHGVKVVRTPIGEANVLAEMRAQKAAVGGEGNGGVIVPAVHPGRDAATALALIILGLQHVARPLSRWNASIPDPHMLKGKVDLGATAPAKVIAKARRAFKDAAELDERDGVKFLFADGWVHLRASNTEPILRIFAEGEDKAHARALMARVEGLLI